MVEILKLFTLAAAALFSVLVIMLAPATKRIAYFFFLLVLVIFSTILFFSGVFALLAGPLFLLFFLLIYLYAYNQKRFLPGQPEKECMHMKKIIPGTAFCIIIGYLFYYFSFGALYTAQSVEQVTLMNFTEIAKEYYTSYFLVTAFVLGSLFSTFVWIILDINKTRR